jgi:rhodanese-related sulfurtransferase
MPFYQALSVAIRGQSRLRTLAIFPQPRDRSAAYLAESKVDISDIYQVDLQRMGLSGTPALLLVDRSGRLVQLWTGLLDKKGMQDVIQHLHVTMPTLPDDPVNARVPPGSDPIVYTAELVSLLHTSAPPPIIDVRNRRRFASGHIEGAYNIPVDELGVRLPHELGPRSSVIVFCNYSEYCAVNSVGSLCGHAESQLRSMNVKMRTVRDRLPGLKAAGVPIFGVDDEAKQ